MVYPKQSDIEVPLLKEIYKAGGEAMAVKYLKC